VLLDMATIILPVFSISRFSKGLLRRAAFYVKEVAKNLWNKENYVLADLATQTIIPRTSCGEQGKTSGGIAKRHVM
jgi:hypothetical protein